MAKMKYRIQPAAGTRYKYALKKVLAEATGNRRQPHADLFEKICKNADISRMTLYRWRNLTHADNGDIPTKALLVIIEILKEYNLLYTVNQLTNYRVLRKHSSAE